MSKAKENVLSGLTGSSIKLDLYHHFDPVFVAIIGECCSLLKDIKQQGVLLMATMQQLQADLTALNTQVTKIGTETTKLIQMVTDLTNALANVQTTPEVDAALAALKAQVQVVDDLVPDAPPPTP